MKRNIRNKLLLPSILVCSLAFLFQRCDKDDTVMFPTELDTLSAGWQKIYVDTSIFFNDIAFVNTQKGFLCGNRYLAISSNGGLTWIRYNLPDSMLANFDNLFFLDANNGWVVSREFLLRTTNGGASWQKVIPPGKAADVQFLSPLIGFLVAMDGVYKSVNGGVNWQKIGTGNSDYYGLYFLNENQGWVSGFHLVEETINGGISYGNKKEFDYGFYYIIQFTDASHGWTTGSTHEVWRTLNGGSSWEKIRTGFMHNDVNFFNNNEGYMSDNKNIFKTSDGGTTFSREVYSPDAEIVEICFTDPNHGWATSNGYIFRYSK